MRTIKKQKQHYVDNQEFLAAVAAYKKKVFLAAEKEIDGFKDLSREEQLNIIKKWDSPAKPRVNNYIGGCFLKIATHLSYKPNFVNYMFRDEMISDGIENCIQYIHNFNPEKSSNPFAYFTQVIYFAFLRRIAKEKKQLEIKTKILERTGYDHVMYTESFDGEMAGLNQNYSDMTGIKETLEIKNKR